jgi:superfamily II DNA/RNA helicase
MFSATWPEAIRALADTFLKKDALRVVVGSDELSANHRVKQIVECIEPVQKDGRILKLLDQVLSVKIFSFFVFVHKLCNNYIF